MLPQGGRRADTTNGLISAVKLVFVYEPIHWSARELLTRLLQPPFKRTVGNGRRGRMSSIADLILATFRSTGAHRPRADTPWSHTIALASAYHVLPSLRRVPSITANTVGIIYEGRGYTSYAYPIRPNRPMG
jgi:hypothetical protein